MIVLAPNIIELSIPLGSHKNVSYESALSSTSNNDDDDDSVVLITNIDEARPPIVSDDSVIIETLPNGPPTQHDDRGPFQDIFQALVGGGGGSGNSGNNGGNNHQAEVSHDPPEGCDEKCS